jgi:hypothetical protein
MLNRKNLPIQPGFVRRYDSSHERRSPHPAHSDHPGFVFDDCAVAIVTTCAAGAARAAAVTADV